ncbi:hypothetical protein Tco_0770593 [Tanacetum coccineum]|uniref:Uncharacterized protein n=1 Tax=Tanacetum coccineum TaxID=301880 RepID=A0ABQ4ZG69_9ASTR
MMKATKKSKMQKTDSDLEEEKHLNTFLKLVPDEEGIIDYEALEKRFPIINWESKFYHFDRHGAKCIYYSIFRSDGSSRWIKTFSEMVIMFDRLDLKELYNPVMQRFETTTPEGADLVLWGDLRTMIMQCKYDSGKPRKNGIIKKEFSMRIVSNSELHNLLRFIQSRLMNMEAMMEVRRIFKCWLYNHTTYGHHFTMSYQTSKTASPKKTVSLDLSRLATTLNRLDRSIKSGIDTSNDAIKSRFGGNDESKKMQKYILKQEFEGFSVSNSEGLHKVSLVIRTKPGVDSLSIDDLYNNLRVFESDIKGSNGSSSSAQNVAFVSSESTSSTNDVSTAYGVSTSSGYNSQRENSSSYTDELIRDRLEMASGHDFYKIEEVLQEYREKAAFCCQRTSVDWTDHAEDEQENFALMAYSNSGSDTEYESDSDDEYVIQPSKEQEKPSFAFIDTVKHVKTPRETVKEQNTYSPSPKADKRD